jgi:hypothetical protein
MGRLGVSRCLRGIHRVDFLDGTHYNWPEESPYREGLEKLSELEPDFLSPLA